jgi:hypothetical protein
MWIGINSLLYQDDLAEIGRGKGRKRKKRETDE